MNTRRTDPEPTATTAALTLLAANYKASGQHERAEGILQAAGMVDMEAHRMSGRSLVDALDVMLRARLDDFVADVVAALRDESGRPGTPRDASPSAAPRRVKPRLVPPELELGKRLYTRPTLTRIPASDPRARELARIVAGARAKGSEDLGSGPRTVAIAIAQHGDAGVTRAQLTILTGYKKTTRDLYLRKLAAAGYVTKRDDGHEVVTDAGEAWLGSDYEKLPTGSALRLYWLNELGEGEKNILAYVCKFYPHVVSAESLSKATGYKKTTRDLYVRKLIARRLLDKSGPGFVCASALLFDEEEGKR